MKSLPILLACLLWISGALFSQGKSQTGGYRTSPVSISHTVDTVLGKVYFVHQVQKGHTLYSIGKAYQAQASQMLKDSPENQVQAGEYIYIPFQKELVEDGIPLTGFEGKKPWAVVFLERNSTDSPSANAEETPSQPADAEDEGIGWSDGTSKEKNRKEKKQAKEERQSDRKEAASDMQDREPSMKSAPGRSEKESAEANDSVFAHASVPTKVARKNSKDSLDIALMLPLYSNNPNDRKAYIYLPFFEGASIAWMENQEPDFFASPADSLKTLSDTVPAPKRKKKKAPAMNFRLFDLTESAYCLDKILQDSRLPNADAIMAASFVNQFPTLNRFSIQHRIPFIHPLSERDSMGSDNPYFVQLCASHQTQLKQIAGFVKAYHPQARILILSDSNPGEQDKARMLLQLLPSAQHILFNAQLPTTLKELPQDRQFVIIPFFQKEITAVKTMLPLRQSKGNITLIAPAVWLDYPTIELNYFLQNNLTVYAGFFPSENTPEFKSFAKHYFFVYRGMPNSLAYQGYLSFKWLLDALENNNADFLRHLTGETESETPFHLSPRTGMAGFENTRVRFLKLTEDGLEEIPYFE